MSTTVDLGKITASVTVGTTTTGAAGTNASVSNSGTTQDAVLNFTIPRGAQGVQGPQGIQGNTGPAGPTGPQGPMGDVAVITPEQQAAFTMYSVPGQNTDGPMTQKAVTDNFAEINNDNDADLDITDNVGKVLVRFSNGHLRTKNFNSEIDGQISVGESFNDLEVTDPSGNILMLLRDGQIRTKRFNSAIDGQISVNESANDLEVTDPAGNILMLLRNGHIMTKEFDSSKLGDEFNYYATEFEDAEQALYDKVRNDIDDKTVVLLITTDAHITTEEPYTLKYAKTFRRMAENIGADAIVSLGDIINEKVGTGWDITANRNRIELYMKDTRNTYIPFLYTLAHHEMFSSGYPTFLYGYSADKVLGKTNKYQRYMKPIFDTNNYANFYVDVEPQGLRMIFLDSANVAGHPAGYTQATVDWLTSILSSTTSKIALFTHVPSKNGYSYNPTNNISKVVNDDLVRTALNAYVQGGGKVLGHYCGHAHCDNYGKESDMEYYIIQTACSVPRVDGGVPSNERPNLGTPIYYSDRTVGTINEWCIDVACIHTDIDEVHLFRFGVGQDRSITL